MISSRRKLIAACLGASLLHACGRSSEPQERFPALELQALDGPPATLGALRGGALLVNYWATWCAPCRHEMPSLERLARLAAPRLRVVGVSADEDLNLAREWLRKEKITFTNFADPGMRVSGQALRLDALPQTFLVSSDGRLLSRIRGAREWDRRDVIAGLLRTLDEAAG